MQHSTASNKVSTSVLKGTAILSLGGVTAGIISAISTPLYTRLYSPEQLGYGAIFLAIASCLLPLSTWRLEYALVIEKDDTKIPPLLILCALFTLACSLLVCVLTISLSEHLAFILPTSIVLILPLFILTLSFYNISTYLFTRHQRYRTITINQIVLAITRSALIIILAYVSTELGMAFGILLASVLVCLVCATQLHSMDLWHKWPRVKRDDLRQTLAEHKALVKHSLSTNFLNSIASSLMPVIFSAHFSARAAGLVFIMQQLIAMPAQIIAQALWRTMFTRLSQCSSKAEKSRLVAHTYKVVSPLLLMPLLLIMTLRNEVSTLIGDQWESIASVIAPFSAMIFFNILSNVTSYFVSFNKYRAESAWNAAILLVRITAVFILPLYTASVLDCIQYYALISCAIYFSLNAYWAFTLGFMRAFLYENLCLVVPIICIGLLMPMQHTTTIQGATAITCLLLLALIFLSRYKHNH